LVLACIFPVPRVIDPRVILAAIVYRRPRTYETSSI
jgi:hypothetical protein